MDIVRTYQGVWNLAGSDLPTRPIALSEPIEPTFDPGEAAATFDQKAFEFYQAR